MINSELLDQVHNRNHLDKGKNNEDDWENRANCIIYCGMWTNTAWQYDEDENSGAAEAREHIWDEMLSVTHLQYSVQRRN